MALTRPRLGQLNTSIVAQSDPITVLNQGASSANVDVGFLFNRANGLVSNVAVYWSESAQSFVTAFTSNTGATNSNISPSSYANLTIGSLLSINGNIYLNGVAGTNGQYITATGAGTAWTSIGYAGGVITSNIFPSANIITNLGGTSNFWANTYTSNLIISSGIFWANGTVFSSGAGGGSYGNVQMLANLAAGSNPVVFGSNIVAASGTSSTNTTTGALVVQGGAGIAGSLYVGGIVNFTGNLITGHILPSANVTYDIGSPTLRFRTLYVSGTTIDMGGAQITTDSASGGFAFVPKPTTANPNPLGTVFSPGGGITTINTTGGTVAAGAINTSIENFQGTAKFGNVRLNSEASSTSTTTGALVVTGGAGIAGNVFAGNVLATGFFYANGTPFVSSSYGNTDVASYLPTYTGSLAASTDITALYANAGAQSNSIAGANAAIITANTALKAYTDAQITTANTALKNYVDTGNTTQSNQITAIQSAVTGANAAIVTANTAIKSYVDAQFTNLTNGAPALLDTLGEIATSLGNNASLSTTLLNSIAGSNAAIITANTALKSYVDTQDSAITTAWTSNAGAQANQIAGANAVVATLQANVGSFYTYANATFIYGNANVAANLATFGSNPILTTGNVTAGNLITSGVISAGGAITAPQAGSIIPFYFANTAVFPSAATYHGAVAHSHADGKMYFAHGSNWVELVDVSSTQTLTNKTVSGVSATMTANVSGGNIVTTGQVTATGNITGNFFVGNGSLLTGIDAGGYGNVQMLANLAAGSNPVAFGSNITVTNRVTAANVYSTGVYVGSGSATSGLFWSANSAVINPGITYTASTNPPGYPTRGDQWYNTSTDVFYEYITDGTSSYWIDIVSTVVSSGATGATGPAGPAGTIANTASWIVTTNTTTSTSTTTGALQVAGGAGIAGNVFAGNVLATGFFYSNGTPFVSSGSSSSVTVTTIAPPGTQTAVDIAGGETVTATGSGFNAGITAYIIGANTVTCTTTYTNSTSASFTTNAIGAGTYSVILYNTDGTNGIKPGGITYSSPPVWVTATGALTPGVNNIAYSTSVSATGTGITYGVTSGALPTGLSLNSSSGLISGTPTVANTFNFTTTATNTYNQTTARAFSILAASVVTANILVVAAGGSGGTGYYGGGGGAGGLVESSSTNFSLGVTYTMTVGTGGVGTTTQTNRGGTGGNSSISGAGFTTITAIGGGGGGSRNGDSVGANASSAANGADGGSGGGVGFSYPGTDVASSSGGGSGLQPASASGGYGNKGGGVKDPALGSRRDGQGGGGAGAAASNDQGVDDGGIGRQSSITGSAVYYAGGGGGTYPSSGAGGSGGGGSNLGTRAGTANTGGGGSGGGANNVQGGTGGSGVVIISYPDTFANATTTGSPTVTLITGYKIYKFTGTGTFVVN